MFERDAPIIALFTAPTWCIPCRRFEPHWDQFVKRDTGYACVKVDMGKTPEDTLEHWATKRFSVLGVPSVKAWGGTRYDDYIDIKARTIPLLLKELGLS